MASSDKVTDIPSQKWVPLELACSIVAEQTPEQPHRKYTWKYKGEVKKEGGTNEDMKYPLYSVKDGDATGWTCEVSDWQNDGFTGNTTAVGTETFTITLSDNPYVEHVENIPENITLGDEMKPVIVYRSHLNHEEDVEMFWEHRDNSIIAMVGDGGLDRAEFKLSPYAREEYNGRYRIEITPKGENTILFCYDFTVSVTKSAQKINSQLYSPCVYTVTEEPEAAEGYTIKRYRVEHTDGRLIYEGEHNPVVIDKTTSMQTAGQYVASSRLYRSLDDKSDYKESRKQQFTVSVRDNENFDGSFILQSFSYPSGSTVQFNLTPKRNEGWFFRYSLAENNVYFVWHRGSAAPKVIKYLDDGYNTFEMRDLQYDDSVLFTVYAAKIDGANLAQGRPIDNPLFFYQNRIEVVDKNTDFDVEVGEPLVINITETAPPLPPSGVTRSLAILKGDRVLADNLPIETRSYVVTEGAMQDDSGVYSHEYRDSPSKKDWTLNNYDIVSRKTYTARVVPNMDFDGPNHQTVQVGGTLKLEAFVLKPPSAYTPTYMFKKDGAPIQILNNKIPVYEKRNVTKDDAGVYEFIAFADANGDGNLDPTEKVGYRKKVHVVVTDAPPEPPKRSEIVTVFNEFSGGRASPCPYWVIDELVELFNDPRGWHNVIEDAVYYDWQITIFNEWLKGQDLYLQDSKNGYWCIAHQHNMSIETGYGAFKHYLGR